MTRWLLEVKLSGIKVPLMFTCSERHPRPAFETLVKVGLFDPQTSMWYPPSRIVEAKVMSVGGEGK